MKRFISGVLVGIILSGIVAFAASYVAQPATFKVIVNGQEFASNPPAMVIDGKTYLPLRAMGDALGVVVNWNSTLNQAEVGETEVALATQYSFRSNELYETHFLKHGTEFGNITKEQYLQMANDLINSQSKSVLTKSEDDGDKLFYDVDKNELLVLSTDGYIRTFFKPDDGIDYYNKQ